MSSIGARRRHGSVAWLWLWLSLAFGPGRVLATPAVAVAAETLLLGSVNGVLQDEALLVLREADGGLLLAEPDLRRWRVRLPAQPDLVRDGTAYYRLGALPGVRLSVDESRQQFSATLPAEAFEVLQSRSRAAVPVRAPQRAAWGGYLSYDLLLERGAGAGAAAAFLEPGVFGPLGSATTGLLLRHSLGGPARGAAPLAPVLRLDSTWSLDDPGQLASLRLGDAISHAATRWGAAVRFGGVQYATNFGLQPNLALLPQQSHSGSAVVPSVIDVFVNGAFVTRHQLPPGPFSVTDIPMPAGPGTLRVVVRDALGREQVVERAFIGSAALLRPGLSAFSFEVGRLRNGFGIASNDYGEPIVAGTWRHGLSETFTAEAHAEAAGPGNHAAGLNAALLLPGLGLADLALAASDGKRGRGRLAGLGLSHQGRGFSAALELQQASAAFWQLGLMPTQLAPRRRVGANLGMGLGSLGSVGLGYVRQDRREVDATPVRLALLAWSFSLARSVQASLSLRKSLAGDRATSLGLLLNMPLGERASVTAAVQREHARGQAGAQDRTLTLQQSLPLGTGWGYGLSVDGQHSLRGRVAYQGSVGSWSLEVARQGRASGLRLGAHGSLVTLGGELAASRAMSNAFALVRVPGFEGVRIYNGNQPVGRTDARGVLIVPGLQPYQENDIRLDDQDLPLDARIASMRKAVVPWFRSGVVAEFHVVREAAVELRVLHADGTPVAAGTPARLEGAEATFPVGSDGRLYLSGVLPRNRVVLDAGARHRCAFEFDFQPEADPLPDLGTFTCEGISP